MVNFQSELGERMRDSYLTLPFRTRARRRSSIAIEYGKLDETRDSLPG